MGILSRIALITKAKVNKVLEEKEDEIELVNQRIIELNTVYSELRNATATMLGNQKQLENELAVKKQKVDELEKSIQAEILNNNDEVAEKLFEGKEQYEAEINSLQNRIKLGLTQCENAKKNLKQIKENIDLLERKKVEYASRIATAEAKINFDKALSNIDGKNLNLDSLEQKILSKEATALGLEDLDAEEKNNNFVEDYLNGNKSTKSTKSDFAKYKEQLLKNNNSENN